MSKNIIKIKKNKWAIWYRFACTVGARGVNFIDVLNLNSTNTIIVYKK